MTFGSFKYIISDDPPLGTQDGVLMAVWTIGLWLTFLTGVFAINANAWLSLVGVLPLAAAVAVCALLGTDSGWQRAICGIAFALLLIIWLSWRLELLEWGRWISALIIVVLAAGLAFGGTLLVPQDRFVLRDRYDPPLSPYDYTSPLSGMRSYIKDHKKDVLLTVIICRPEHRFKLAVMDRFDGTVWNLSDSSEATDSSNYHRVGTTIKADEQGKSFTATFTVDQGLTDTWLPLAGAATGVSFATMPTTAMTRFTTTRIPIPPLFPPARVKASPIPKSGIIARKPTDKQMQQCGCGPHHPTRSPGCSRFGQQTGHVPLPAGSPSGGAAATALADTLKDSGWFSHGLEGDYPSDAGMATTASTSAGRHGHGGRLRAICLRHGMMARDLGTALPCGPGLPAEKTRMAKSPMPARRRPRANGTKIEFTGNDVTAWVEIKLQAWDGWRSIRRPRRPRCLMKTRT